MNKKTVALLLALTLVFGASVGGTLAWLTAQSNKVVNTFTSSNIDITLVETKGDGSNDTNANDGIDNKEFAMIPGYQIAKDPKATVLAGSEDCFLFVKLEKSANYGTFLAEYEMAEGWTALEGVAGVYYREVTGVTTDKSFQVLKGGDGDFAGGYLTVLDTVTKADMDAIKDSGMPTLTITAYATQLYSSNNTTFTAAKAWENIGN